MGGGADQLGKARLLGRGASPLQVPRASQKVDPAQMRLKQNHARTGIFFIFVLFFLNTNET